MVSALSGTAFAKKDAKSVKAFWRRVSDQLRTRVWILILPDSNNSRPHSQLSWRTPYESAKTFPRPGTALRYPMSSALYPDATTALRGKSNRKNELQSG